MTNGHQGSCQLAESRLAVGVGGQLSRDHDNGIRDSDPDSDRETDFCVENLV